MAKECNKCKAVLSDDANFCHKCGSKDFTEFAVQLDESNAVVTSDTPVNPNPYSGQEQKPYTAPIQQPYVQPNQSPYTVPVQQPYVQPQQNQYTAPVQQPVQQTVEPKQKKEKKKGKKKFLIPIIAVILVAAIAVSVFAVPYVAMASSPLVKVGNGVVNLVTSGDTYAVSGTIEAEGDRIDFDGKFNIDYKNQTAAFDGTASCDGEKADGLGYISVADKNVILDFDVDGYELIMVNDIFGEDGDCYQDNDTYDGVIKIAPVVFEALDYIDEPTDEKLTTLVNDACAVIEELSGEEINITVNSDANPLQEVLDILADDLKKSFLDKGWLEENLGYEKTSGDGGVKLHSFDFSLGDAAKALLEIAEDNKEELMPIIVDTIVDAAGDEYDIDANDVEDEIEDLLDEMSDEVYDLDDLDVSLSVGIKGSDIRSIDFSFGDADETYFEFDVTIEKVDGNVGVDVDSYNKRYDEMLANVDDNYYY